MFPKADNRLHNHVFKLILSQRPLKGLSKLTNQKPQHSVHNLNFRHCSEVVPGLN